MRYIGILVLLFVFLGCGSSSEPVKVSYKSTFVMFNARKVSNDMQVNIEINDKSEYNRSIHYAKEDFKDIWWYEDDNITVKYSQDDNLNVSMPIIQKSTGRYLICSVGNAKNSTLPVLIDPLDKKELYETKAHIRVLNTINDGIEKRVYINYESDRSDFTAFNSVSEKFYINAASNSLVYVQYRGNNTPFEFFDSINFDAKHAYIIIIYEDAYDETKPQIKIVDITP